MIFGKHLASRVLSYGLVGCLAIVVLCAESKGDERDIQLTSIDFNTDIIELHNFGSIDQPLDGWRFCTHNDDQGERRYTSVGGLNGVTIEAGTSLFIWVGNNGPQDSDNLDVSQMGGNFATTLDQGPYSINLYWPNGGSLSFSQPTDMVDHMQWNIGGIGSTAADVRNIVAENAGLWVDDAQWISTTANTSRLELTDPNGGLLHGPSDYLVVEPSAADFTGDGNVDGADLDLWELSYNLNDGADANEDGLSDGDDFLIWQVEESAALTAAVSAVPEPSSAMLLLLGPLVQILHRTRQA